MAILALIEADELSVNSKKLSDRSQIISYIASVYYGTIFFIYTYRQTVFIN